MVHCALCGQRFDNDGWRWMCPMCFSGPNKILWDGSEEQKALIRALFIIANKPRGGWSEEDLQMIADSFAFARLVEMVMPHMETKCFVNLIQKVQRAVAGS